MGTEAKGDGDHVVDIPENEEDQYDEDDEDYVVSKKKTSTKPKRKKTAATARAKKPVAAAAAAARTKNSKAESISLQSWAKDLISNLRKSSKQDSNKKQPPTIHRVPGKIRGVHEQACTPTLVAVGPFYYSAKGLESGNDYKNSYLEETLLRNFTEGDEEKRLEILIDGVKGLEEKARACYSEDFEISSDDFVRMMVTDGCFVIQLLRYCGMPPNKENELDGSSTLITNRWTLQSLQQDLILLENQIPFFVLHKLYELTKVNKEEPSLPELIVTFFNPLLPRENANQLIKQKVDEKINKEEMGDDNAFNHMLDLFRSTFLPSKEDKKSDSSEVQSRKAAISCVTELSKDSLTFANAKDVNLLGISFNNGNLSIPPLVINDSTLCLFLNFVAYEQCYEKAFPFFINYFMFIDGLIDTTKDVKVLTQNEIFYHAFTTDVKATNVINNMGKALICDLDKNYLSKEMEEIDEYRRAYNESRWHQFKHKCCLYWENFMDKYFGYPWTAASLIAAVVLLILTVLQTFYTMYAYYIPPN